MRVAIFASGNGTNFEILAQQFLNQQIPGQLSLLFCDHPQAPVIKRAERLGITWETFTVKECGNKVAYEQRLVQLLKDYKIDFIILAGYLRVIGSPILDYYPKRIINLHPAYLPEYPGLHSIERALADKKTQTGVTIHYIDAGLDSGPIITQKRVPILPNDTLTTLEARVHACEHQLYPQVVKQLMTAFEKKEQI
ncbi:MAG: phosphoribosylglycinamide formyltransferase [Liquorilactobacillus nagelii]|jgi:phosphoribosylglycinamide formyltransferase-1|uniref:phosphoribosylglycinamide formyltransferase n=1 Tax=Liquorilactobacillus nagelii TaxID=82688 RepID=UPI00242E30EC|nr:phosphoribosylglycinamide formyltransferase [Liquorilactobacillus nagelii]MCI1922230.1 phosphoribosylglycinamide formyltransferase [Liquorilactobacillus nagelii]MCI1977357.1 phosphoribosylglycinamide formyltransferase [Liquorilactobacillus nagelii]